jgi:hypothetical protein
MPSLKDRILDEIHAHAKAIPVTLTGLRNEMSAILDAKEAAGDDLEKLSPAQDPEIVAALQARFKPKK